MIGKIKRKEVFVTGSYYNFDQRFHESMAWIDDTIEVISITPLSVDREEHKALYEVIYREKEFED